MYRKTYIVCILKKKFFFLIAEYLLRLEIFTAVNTDFILHHKNVFAIEEK